MFIVKKRTKTFPK